MPIHFRCFSGYIFILFFGSTLHIDQTGIERGVRTLSFLMLAKQIHGLRGIKRVTRVARRGIRS